jgi:hypothetical protein
MPEYAAHGSHQVESRLRVYHQGGLDTYCAFYAVLNLVNFLKFKEDTEKGDFIGADEFKEFRLFINAGGLTGYFPESPLGDEGLRAPMLIGVLSGAFEHFRLRCSAVIQDDPSVDPMDKSHWDKFFRYGTEKPFSSPQMVDQVLGLAVVKEDDKDHLGHWVVLVGKSHLKGTAILCEDHWDGIVLDSDRGYERWRVATEGKTKLPRVFIRRGAETGELPIDWIYSFISVSQVG